MAGTVSRLPEPGTIPPRANLETAPVPVVLLPIPAKPATAGASPFPSFKTVKLVKRGKSGSRESATFIKDSASFKAKPAILLKLVLS